jgi:hypothetical protein
LACATCEIEQVEVLPRFALVAHDSTVLATRMVTSEASADRLARTAARVHVMSAAPGFLGRGKLAGNALVRRTSQQVLCAGLWIVPCFVVLCVSFCPSACMTVKHPGFLLPQTAGRTEPDRPGRGSFVCGQMGSRMMALKNTTIASGRFAALSCGRGHGAPYPMVTEICACAFQTASGSVQDDTGDQKTVIVATTEEAGGLGWNSR